MEVFGRGADFDPSQDSMVRVYAHNLRQKLEHYYATAGRNEPRQLLLARGEYRISLAESDEPDEAVDAAAPVASPPPQPAPVPEQPSAFTRWRWRLGGSALLVLGIALGAGIMLESEPAAPAAAAVAKSPLWADMLDDDLPILVVVGDYYIYGELD